MPDPVYRITNWGEHYENNRTREVKQMHWVPVKIKMDGDGYITLVCDDDNGAAHYGAWHAIINVAARCRPRGTLLRDNCVPYNSASLSTRTRIAKNIFDEAIPRLLEIGWLEVSHDNCTTWESCKMSQVGADNAAVLRQACALQLQLQLQNKETPLTPQGAKGVSSQNLFKDFWSALPECLRQYERAAQREYNRLLRAGVTHSEIMAGLPGYIEVNEPRTTAGSETHAMRVSTWLRDGGYTNPKKQPAPKERGESCACMDCGRVVSGARGDAHVLRTKSRGRCDDCFGKLDRVTPDEAAALIRKIREEN